MSTLPSRARVALVGYGLGGSKFHAPFIAAEPRLDLAVIVTASPTRQVEAASHHPGARVLPSVEALLKEMDDIDLVAVSTPNATHVAIAEAVMAAGRPVVVDKPVAPSADEVRHLVGLAESSGTAMVPFQNRRWDGDFRTVVALLEDGRLGRLHGFESRYERWQPQVPSGSERSWKREPGADAGTGILYDLGAHIIDQALVLFGRPESVYADIATRRAEAAVDDDVFIALLYPDGPRVHLWASLVAANQGPRFRLLGDAAAYVKTGMDVQEAALMEGRSPMDPAWGVEPPDSWGHLEDGTQPRAVPTVPGAYQLFYAGMAAYLLDGAAPPVAGDDAIATAEVIEAAQRSARSGAVEPLALEGATTASTLEQVP
ncbi:MAG TPA: Gfo/Idh/MocA family oxidoreductase [Acidimicrobiales bacterium]|nr:Gfo/Idh/MocA family oxidoreductase [Acidimicrobiales bacterium]